MRILLLGANGFIGRQIAHDLIAAGHNVIGMVRRARDVAPAAGSRRYAQADISRLTSPNDWRPFLEGVEAVINCAGALQSGGRDNVSAVQRDAIIALIDAAKAGGVRLFVNISAPLEGAGAQTEFFATKRAADAHLAESGLPFVILRPALVLGRNCHGGSALIRALAALPFVLPLAWPDAKVRMVALKDVSGAVIDAVSGKIAPGSDVFLAHEKTYALAEIIVLTRDWLGLRPAPVIAMPGFVAAATSKIADFLGLLGWRSPMRTTAMIVAGGGIATATSVEAHHTPTSLEAMLGAEPAGVQDLWFARLYLFKPVIFGVLSLFWITSGVIALVELENATATAISNGFPAPSAPSMAIATALADIGIGIGIAVRRWCRPALLASLVLSFAYLCAATWFSPGLWLDPLGPLVKILPAMALSVVALAIFEERP